ncbi:MAG: glycoside hydrolase family 88 protein, partial [Bacteroidia bacterium]|nr:glycoside hydrolase family 88 protein [Bacteroidia bacterium]
TRVLDDLPFYDPHREEYLQVYREMADAIVACQQPGGFWTRSLLDPNHAPGYETSGTAFFTKGLLWGINNKILNSPKYTSAALDAWNYLTTVALQDNGKLGYVQPIGEKAIPGQVVNENSTANFGVGAFLLVACELVRYIDNQQEWKLIWNDEFNHIGKPNSDFWSYENGFIRNEEFQWYQPDNAHCENGVLIIESRNEQLKNPHYNPQSKNWRENRQFAEYTSSSIKTQEKKEFQYGRFEIRAKIPVETGSWPAIWTLGTTMPWPSNGEIDIMEYYLVNGKPAILANAAWGTHKQYVARWNDEKVPFSHFTKHNPNWENEFHIWRMDWDSQFIRLYLDDVLLNTIKLEETYNGTIGNGKNPFRQPHYILLNLAIGAKGGEPNPADFPLRYKIDYVRVYQR